MRRMLLVVAAVLYVGVGVTAVWALAARFVLHGEVTATSLAESVTDAAPSAGSLLGIDGACTPQGRAGVWECGVMDGGGSGGATYRVVVRDGSSCWRARKVQEYAESPMPARMDGCVRRWQWALTDLIT